MATKTLLYPIPTVEALGRQFAINVWHYVGNKNWATIRRENAANTAGGAGNLFCASQDYCDANQSMLDAFEMLTGREMTMPSDVEDSDEDGIEAQEEAEEALVELAWAWARQHGGMEAPVDEALPSDVASVQAGLLAIAEWRRNNSPTGCAAGYAASK